jgi:DNA-binding SARP family transcriptional activator
VGEEAWRANLKGKRLFELLLSSRSFQVSADEAVEALWPTAPPDKGRHRLHMAVTRLRKTLDEIGAGDLIEIRYEHSFYRLVLDDNVSIDHTTFQSLAERGLVESSRGRHRRAYDLLTAAVRLHSGVFLDDALYERFTDFRRDHLSDLLGKAIHELGSSPLVSRQEALQWWGKALEHDCYDESAYRAALECCSELGLHGKALAYYSMMNHHLVEELGIPRPDWAKTFVALAQQSCTPRSS